MKKARLFLITVYLFILAIITSCGGGGGGGGGAVSFQNSGAKYHNGGGNSGWGTGNQTGGGFGGTGIQSGDLLISQMAALNGITSVRIELVINGVAQEPIIADATTKTDVLPKIKIGDTVSGKAYIYVDGEASPREAELDQTEIELSNTLKFKVPYYYTCVNSSGAEIVPSTVYYARDGIDLSAHTTSSMVGWLCIDDNKMHNGSHISGVRGDITLTPVYNAPDCTISVAPGTGITSRGSDVYEISALTDFFNFAVALTDGSSFPDGTNISWQINGTPVSGTTPETCSASPSSLSISAVGSNASTATALNVSCIIEIPGEPVAAATKTVKVYQKITLPSTFNVRVQEPSSAIVDSTATNAFNITSRDDPFTFTAGGTGVTFPVGTTFQWMARDTVSGQLIYPTGNATCLIKPSDMYSASYTISNCNIRITCTINHPDAVTSVTKYVDIKITKIPACRINMTPPGSATASGNIYKLTDLSDDFDLVAATEDGTPFPAGTQFEWKRNGTTVSSGASSSYTFYPSTVTFPAGTGTNATNAYEVELKCIVKRTGLPDTPVVKTIKLYKPVTLTGFDIYVDNNMYTGTAYPVYDTSTPINFSVFTAAGLPYGTVYNWTITNQTSGTSVQKQGDNINVMPTEMGTIGTSESTASTWTVSCTISHPDNVILGQTITEILSPTFSIYKVTIPACSVSVQAAPTGAVANGDTYKVNDSSGSFTFKVSRASSTEPVIPANSKCQWSITKADGTLYQPSVTTSTEITVSMSELGYLDSNIPIEPANAKTITASCTVSHDNLPVSEAKTATPKTAMIYRQMVSSDFASTSVSTSASYGTIQGNSGYLNSNSASTPFTFTVARSDGGTFPTGTTFYWEIWSGTSSTSWRTADKTLTAPTTTATFQKSQFGVSMANHGYQRRYVYCTVTLPGETDGYKVYITSVTFVQ
ncbi:MAG: hypothetical protein J5631_14470 [Spirochaetaceae bacterium]|nr:hypothetical protein [Spirochaetaceae bacterium]